MSAAEERQAQDPSTDPERLAALALSPDPRVRMFTAKNPGLPAAALFGLARQHPREVLANPIFPLLLLGDLSVIHEADPDAVEALLRQKEAPEGLLWAVAQGPHARLRFWIARHPALSPRLLRLFLLHEDATLRLSASKNPSRPRELMRLLLRAGADLSLSEEKRGPQFDPALSTEELRGLYELDGFYAKWLALQHPACPEALFVRAAQERSTKLAGAALQWLRRNPGHPEAATTYQALLAHPDAELRALSLRARAPIEEELRRVRGLDLIRRRALARLPETPDYLLWALAEDPDPLVQRALDQNPTLPSALRARRGARGDKAT